MNAADHKLILNDPRISKICPMDEPEFYDMIGETDNPVESFENNWPYIIQATRSSGYKFKHDNGIVYFWIREKTMVVVHRVGQERIEILNELKVVARANSLNILVKNVNQKEIPKFNNNHFFFINNPWSKYSLMDDNSFPQTVCDIKKIISLEHPPIRRSTARIIRQIHKTRNIQMAAYSQKHEKEGLNLLKSYSEYLENKGVDDKVEVYKAHIFYFYD